MQIFVCVSAHAMSVLFPYWRAKSVILAFQYNKQSYPSRPQYKIILEGLKIQKWFSKPACTVVLSRKFQSTVILTKLLNHSVQQ